DQTRAVDLGYQGRGQDDGVGCLDEPVLEEGPRQESGKGEDRVRHALGRDVRQPAEEEAEDQHGEEGLEYGPRHAERGLLVSDLDVSPGEVIKELAELDDL